MGLDIAWLDTKAEPVLTLRSSDLAEIEPAVQALHRVAGLYLDPYGDTRLSPQHAGRLASEIRRLAPKNATVLSLVELLETAETKDEWLFFVGD